MTSIAGIGEPLRGVATSGMKPKAVLAAVRGRHPGATKKEVVRAAFYALTESHGGNPEHLGDLHSFALMKRATEEDESVKAGKPRRKKPNGKATRSGGACQPLLTALDADADEATEGCAAGPAIAADLLQHRFQRHDALARPAVGPFQLVQDGIDSVRDGAVGHGGEIIDRMEAAAHRGHAPCHRSASETVQQL